MSPESGLRFRDKGMRKSENRRFPSPAPPFPTLAQA